MLVKKNNTIARVEPLQKTTENINVFNSIDELQKLVDSDVPTENFNIRKSYRIFLLHAGNGGGFGYYLGKSLSDSRNMKSFRLISGEAYAYTTDEKGNYKGMVVRKYIK